MDKWQMFRQFDNNNNYEQVLDFLVQLVDNLLCSDVCIITQPMIHCTSEIYPHHTHTHTHRHCRQHHSTLTMVRWPPLPTHAHWAPWYPSKLISLFAGQRFPASKKHTTPQCGLHNTELVDQRWRREYCLGCVSWCSVSTDIHVHTCPYTNSAHTHKWLKQA